jgi:cytochrome c peroxidase
MRALDVLTRAGKPAAFATRAPRTWAVAVVAMTSIETFAQPVADDGVRAAARVAALASGLDSLARVPVPGPDLRDVLNPGPAAKTALVELGKALFWDTQAGSDGQACASCHFHAGADSRARNQLSPGLRAVPADLLFGNNLLGVPGFPQLQPDDILGAVNFPLHVLKDPEESNFSLREVLRDTNDVVSSMGVFPALFTGIMEGVPFDGGDAFLDPTFNRDTPSANTVDRNVRRVEPRNTPTVFNAVFNHSNFWDGRAHFLFNGVSVIGPLDPGAAIWVASANGKVSKKTIRLPFSSLASQAVGPPTSDLEMSFFNRPFPMVGRKLLSLTPLGRQVVDPTDSVLGPLANRSGTGLTTSYAALIKAAFQSKLWRGENVVLDSVGVTTQMEANFTLFWGLAIQAYEQLLVSDAAPFDAFMEGVNGALTPEQIQGLLVFLNRGARGNVPEVEEAIRRFQHANGGIVIGAGNCVSCHGGAAFSDATFPALAEPSGELELIEIEDTSVLIDGLLAVSTAQGLLDNGFSNIGVRPTRDDLGRGGTEDGFPLAFSRQLFTHPQLLAGTVQEAPCKIGKGPSALPPCPAGTGDPLADGLLVDGAFKIPTLRNVELTGPFFHNGGQATLGQVIEFYDRQGDFGDVNIGELDRNLVFIDLDDTDEDPLVEFLLSLTDERVRIQAKPFDHPQLVVPNGGTLANEVNLVVPAVGAAGDANHPLDTFLGLPHAD